MAATDTARARRRPWVVLAVATAVTAAVLLGLLAPHGSHSAHVLPGSSPVIPNPGGPEQPGAHPAALALAPFTSCDAALADLRSHAAASVGPYGFGAGIGRVYANGNFAASGVAAGAPEASSAAGSATDATAAGANPDVSTTNVQEPGVDEPDIVKTDGHWVLSVLDGTLRVVDTRTHRVTGTLDLSIYAGAQSAQLLADGDHAVVILSGASEYPNAYGGVARLPMPVSNSSGGSSTVLFVDLSGQPAVTGTLRLTGQYVDARSVNGVVRLVQVSAPVINFPMNNGGSDKSALARNQATVRNAPLSAWQPTYTLATGSTSATRSVPCTDISRPAKYTGTSLVTIYTIDAAHPSADPQPVSLAADGDTVYATAASLYVISNATCEWCVTPSPQPTQIHRFDTSHAGKPTYLGSGSVPGTLLSQYSLSDYAGHLRVAVTMTAMRKVPVIEPDAPPLPGQPTSTSSVYVLDDRTLAVTGHVDGLGANEQIHAVRFLGALGFVVTFRSVDPLYVLDLADPAHPRTVDAVQLTGYSDYLHDVGSGRLLGVGQAIDDTSRVSGVQVSLFDVRTPSATRLADRYRLPDTPDETRLDPHAFLYWAPTGLVAIPVQTWQPDQSGKVLVLRVVGAKLVQVGLVANPQPVSAPNDGQGIQRSVLVDGSLWTISGAGVQVSSATSLAREAWVPFG